MPKLMRSPIFPWLLAGILALLVLALTPLGYWREVGVGGQIPVPMFYDAHYLFPRPWTQEQSTPLIPPPAPIAALYAGNQLSQIFTPATDHLSMIRLWVAGSYPLEISLRSANKHATATISPIPHGRFIHLRLPDKFAVARQPLKITLSAPQAEPLAPVTVRAVAGSRLGDSIQLNEYGRPGNLELFGYAQGLPGKWWLWALLEQNLPETFRLRLRQYKPIPFKGNSFFLLLILTVAFSSVFLLASMPAALRNKSGFGWLTATGLTFFLGWQLGGSRLLLPGAINTIPMQLTTEMPATSPIAAERLIHDFALTLWTAERLPEARWAQAEWLGEQAAITAPGNSELRYNLLIPPNARLTAGIAPPRSGQITHSIIVGNDQLYSVRAQATHAGKMVALDLSPFAGQVTTISFVTESEGGDQAVWLSPQLSSDHAWLSPTIPPDSTPAFAQFNQTISLVGFKIAPDAAGITLFWEANALPQDAGIVFLHLLDQDGNLVGQHDGQPVGGAYPTTVWQPGMIIADFHPVKAPAEAVNMAVGVYHPGSFVRWGAATENNTPLPSDQLIMPLEPIP